MGTKRFCRCMVSPFESADGHGEVEGPVFLGVGLTDTPVQILVVVRPEVCPSRLTSRGQLC